MADAAERSTTGPGCPVVVGRILAPYGIRGWVHVAAFTDPKENLLEYRPWLLADAHQSSWQQVTVQEIRPHGQGFVASLAGVADRDAAERLKGRLIGVPESELPAVEGDEHYWRDLIGATVVDTADVVLGRVQSLIETGVHDVLVVERPDGRELLIPFHARYVLDVAGDRIRVDWPEMTD